MIRTIKERIQREMDALTVRERLWLALLTALLIAFFLGGLIL
jgi:hypothetical protein